MGRAAAGRVGRGAWAAQGVGRVGAGRGQLVGAAELGGASVVRGVVVRGAVVVGAGAGASVVGSLVLVEDSSSSVVVLGAVVVGRVVVLGGADVVPPVVVDVGTVVVVGAGASVVGARCSVLAGAGSPRDVDMAAGSQAKNSATKSTASTTVDVRARPIRAGTRRGHARLRRVAGSAVTVAVEVTVGTGVVGWRSVTTTPGGGRGW